MAILDREPQNKTEHMLHHANRLAQKLRKARFRSGALNLDLPEHKVFLDAKGRVSEVRRIENDISHQLIEEFMLLANEAVAKEISVAGPTVHGSTRSRTTKNSIICGRRRRWQDCVPAIWPTKNRQEIFGQPRRASLRMYFASATCAA